MNVSSKRKEEKNEKVWFMLVTFFGPLFLVAFIVPFYVAD